MAYNPYITLVRKDRKGQSRVSVLTLSKTMDKIRSNVNMDEFEALRTDINPSLMAHNFFRPFGGY